MQQAQCKKSDALTRLADGRENLIAERRRLGNWGNFHREQAGLVDAYFQERLAEVWPSGSVPAAKGPLTLVAVGGYGRSELCLYSDIDILIVHERSVPPQALDLAQSLFFPLWDLGFDLGHTFRSFSECAKLAKKDFQVLASLLDARFIAGNPDLYDRFMRKMESSVFEKKRGSFAEWLKEQSQAKLAQFGDASGLLEPNIKEGLGGLRDYHRIRWLLRLQHGPASLADLAASGRISRAEADVLTEHNAFLLNLRNQLHDISGRKNDILYFEYQEEVAKRLGFKGSGTVLAVESFLASLHRRLADVKVLHAHFWSRALAESAHRRIDCRTIAPGIQLFGDELLLDEKSGPPSPGTIAAAFDLSAREGFVLSWEARNAVTAAIMRDPGAFATKELFAALVRLLDHDFACAALTQMLETGYLGALIPQFGRIQDHMQFDAYHIHPVGRHSVAAVQHLLHLREEPDPPYSDLWRELPHPERLLLAALLHDIGKGTGGEHSAKGAKMAGELLPGKGLGQEAIEDIVFLVEQHLLLADTASRRDLSDEAVIFNCAAVIGSEDRLKMLHLLTLADSKATGPKAWSQWQLSLRAELFAKVLRVLRHEYADAEEGQRMLGVRDKVRASASAVFDPREVEELLSNMPPRYAMSLEPDKIVEHFGLIHDLHRSVEEDSRMMTRGRGGQGVLEMRAVRDGVSNCWCLTLAALASPDHFATITGVLALHDLNILSAELFRWRDSIVVSVIRVCDPPDSFFVEETWQKIRRSYRYAMTGKLSLDYRLAEKRRSPFGQPGARPLSKDPSVRVDNASSDFHTLIEVRADDRAGLLHDIAATLQSLQLEVHLAKISTHVDQILDVFYVRDLDGQKVEDPAQIREIEAAVLYALRRS